MLHQDDLKAIAEAKLEYAELLFENRRFSNSYYLFGYAAEIALKARIAGAFVSNSIPDKKLVNDIYSHDLEKLAGIAGLSIELGERRRSSAIFDGHWSTVTEWSEQARYSMIDVFQATAMRVAMIDSKDGVFGWLRERW